MQVLPFNAGVLAGYSSAFYSFSFDEEPTVEAVAMDNLAAYANAFDLIRSSA